MEPVSPVSPGRIRKAIPAGVLSVAPALALGFALRAWMLAHFFQANGDTLIYGGIARNLLLHGRYALTANGTEVYSTLMRLPGYPFFLAGCFQLFGIENYGAVAWLQIAMDLLACLLLADFARRMVPPAWCKPAAHATLWLAALCPFTAIYAATPLTEGPTLFSIALALFSGARFARHPRWGAALTFTIAVTFAALLRPDGALVAIALTPMLLHVLLPMPRLHALRMATACLLIALAPFAVWTARNWLVFHVLQPLVPASATDPDEGSQAGWDSWVKTWSLDFTTTYTVYWNVPGDVLDMSKLPPRAFDSPAQQAVTAKLAADYNAADYTLTPEIDARFAQLAAQRIAHDPIRYYVQLPLGRVADMWLRPRIENLPVDVDWWVYQHHRAETRFSWFYVGLNALFLLLALVGLLLRPRWWPCLLGYMLLRSALLATIGGPEARYTLECFPMLFALGGVTIAAVWTRLGESHARPFSRAAR